jgi:hypothetical protein
MANNINILGDLVSVDALKRVEELAKSVEKIAKQSEIFINNINKAKSGDVVDTSKQEASIAKLQALVTKLEEQNRALKVQNEEKLNALKEQNILKIAKLQDQIDSAREKRQQATTNRNMTTAEKVDRSYNIAQEKLEAQAVSQLATELQRLYAQQELANREAQKVALSEGLQSTAFFEASKKAKDLTAEIIKLETATGKMAGRATNTNHALFSLSQVVRELPNFAISARIGFMSLSNNLPQLVDGFNTLKNSVDETGKKLGSIGALKAFASSLLSLNTVVIIATTLMVAYGDKVWKWVESMFKAVDVTDKYSMATKTLLKVFSDASSEASKMTDRMLHLGIAIDKYKSGTLSSAEQSKQANWIVKEYNETLGIHDKKITSVTEAIKGYNDNAKEFIEYTIAMNASMLSIQESANQLQRARGAQTAMDALIPNKKDQEEALKFWSGYKKSTQDYYATQRKSATESNNLFANELENKEIDLERYTEKITLQGDVYELDKQEAENKRIYNELSKKYGEDETKEFLKQLTIQVVAKNKAEKAKADAISFYKYDESKDSPTGGGRSGGGNVVQTARTKFIAEEFYDKQRIELVKRMAELEDEISKSKVTGELNDYKVREEANEKYYKASMALAETDKNVAIKNLHEKTDKELKDLEKIDSENKKKYDNKKITQEEYMRANAINAEAEKTIIKNNEVELLKISDEYEKKALENKKKYYQEDRKIMQDLYADKAYLMERETEKMNNLYDLQSKKNLNKIRKTGTGEIAVSSFSGFEKDTSFDEAKNEFEKAQKNIDAKIFEIEGKLAIVKKGSEEEKALNRELDATLTKGMKERADYEISLEEKKQKKLMDIKKKMAQKAEELVLALIKSYYDKQLNLLEKRDKLEKVITEERYKDVEDREKAGVITKKEAEDEKARIAVYAKGQEEQIEREKLELKKKQFYIDQGIALAKIAISTAQAVMQVTAQLGVGAPVVIPFILGLGALEAGIVMAQQPPAFKDGGVMPYDGVALVGDGGKHEVLITPDGKIGITPNKDTYMNLEAGTRILPDVNKLNLDSLVAYMNIEKSSMSTKVLENEIKGLRKDINRKKQPILSNAPLLKTIEFGNKINIRSRSI